MNARQLTIRNFTYPTPLTILWVLMAARLDIASVIIGYTLSFFLIWLLLSTLDTLPAHRTKNLPLRFALMVWYVVQLNFEIIMSGIDVFLRIVGVRPIRSGIVAVAVQDPDDNQVVAGLSAHSITITPGQLVVAYDRDGKTMYVHCLDVETMAASLEESQVKRVKMLRRILGLD